MNRINLSLGMILIIICLVMTGCQAHTSQAKTARVINKHIQLGNQLYDRGCVSEAVREWEVALVLDPNQPQLSKRIQAIAAGKTVDVNASLIETKTNLSSGAQERILRKLQKADHCYQLSQLKDAEVTWQQVLQLDPENQAAKSGLQKTNEERYQVDPKRGFDNLSKANYEKGMTFYRKKEWLSAEAQLAKAANLSSEQAQVKKYLEKVRATLAQQQALASVAQLRQEVAEAEKNEDWRVAHAKWKQIKAIEPEAQDAKEGLMHTQKELHRLAAKFVISGDTAQQAKQYGRAAAKYRQALKYNPENAQAKKGLAKVRQVKSQGQAIKTNKNKAKKRFAAGADFYKAGQHEKAMVQWEQAVAMDPENAEYGKWLQRAQTENEKQAAKDCQLAKTRYNDGLQAFQREDLETALSAFTDVIEICPDGSEAAKAKKHITKIKKLLK